MFLNKVQEICDEVKKKLEPTRALRHAVETKAEEIRLSVQRECANAAFSADVRLEGSLAKDTWPKQYFDADIFMMVSPQLTKDQLREVCLPIARNALKGHEIVERFAEHPYIESTVNMGRYGKLRVNVVPCYNVESGKWQSATDRTPYHTAYVREHLKPEQRAEVRLLKAFMRSIGSYGADIKTGGFSGMLCETLILSRGDFPELVQSFSEWSESQFIDVENYYDSRREEVRRIFREALVVIDPVDKGRNLGAAVRLDQLWNFVAASRYLMAHPTRRLFEEQTVQPLRVTEYRTFARNRGIAILGLVTGRIDAVVDILWSQLYRTQRALISLLQNSDFTVIRSMAWSDEKSLNVILFEVEALELPLTKVHKGPPVSRAYESSLFLAKHVKAADTISGPWVENGRWMIKKKRGITSARTLLATALKRGGVDVGVATFVSDAIRREFRILESNQISSLIASNAEFARNMRTYLSGRPAWLA